MVSLAGRVVGPPRGDARRLRILIICYEFPPAGGGGGRVAASVARGLADRGHVVRVLTSHVRGLASEETCDGVTIRRAFAGRRRLDRCSVAEMAMYVAAHAVPAASEVRRFAPDVVHVHFAVPSGVVAWFASLVGRVPYVLTVHLGDVPGGVPEQTDRLFRLIKPLTRPIWRRAVTVTAVAPHVAQLAQIAYGRPVEVIRNGIDMRSRATPGRPPSGTMLRAIWCGRVQSQKNLAAGIAGLRDIAGQDWTLDIVGDGPLRDQAEECSVSCGLAGQIRFRGWLSAAATEALMSEVDVLFLPSLSEGLSLATVEALRAGLAFVASRIPGIEDLVAEGENGFLCDPGRPETFAKALSKLVDDRGLLYAMRCESANRAALFNEERMIDAYAEVLGRAAAAGRR